MLRRTLQFVLMLAVLLSTSAAQAYAMPCCETARVAMAAPATPVSAQDEAPAMHCHDDMQMSEAVPMPQCTAASCTAQSETTTANTEDAALQPLAYATAVSWDDVPVTTTGSHTDSATLFVPPDIHQRAPVPLRV